jgi:hypothetical protein
VAKVLMLHVGAPKTGTSYLQRVIWDNVEVLAAQGIGVPFDRPRDQLAAIADLRATTWSADLDGANWRDLADGVNAVPGTCLVSEELLCSLPPASIEKFLTMLDPGTETHVIYAARDAGRQVPAMWQHIVRGRHTITFEAFLSWIRADPKATYWADQCPLQALDRWGSFVASGRFHLMTVPASGEEPAVLWQRFAGIIGVDPSFLTVPDRVENPSIGLLETEVLRRLNERLGTRFPMRKKYISVVRNTMIQPGLTTAPAPVPIYLPADFADWLSARTTQRVEELANRSDEYDLVGDLAELDQPIKVAPPGVPATTDDSAVLTATLDAWIRQLEHLEAEDEERSLQEQVARDSMSAGLLRRVGRRVRAGTR